MALFREVLCGLSGENEEIRALQARPFRFAAARGSMVAAMRTWVREGELARSTRPGYAPGAEFSVPRGAVDTWVEETRSFGIVSIICLLAGDQLPLYDRALPGGLVQHYRACGFHVAHIPTPDGQQHPFTPDQLNEAWQAYQRLPKPVLIHCSAGYDRTGRIVEHLLRQIADPEP